MMNEMNNSNFAISIKGFDMRSENNLTIEEMQITGNFNGLIAELFQLAMTSKYDGPYWKKNGWLVLNPNGVIKAVKPATFEEVNELTGIPYNPNNCPSYMLVEYKRGSLKNGINDFFTDDGREYMQIMIRNVRDIKMDVVSVVAVEFCALIDTEFVTIDENFMRNLVRVSDGRKISKEMIMEVMSM